MIRKDSIKNSIYEHRVLRKMSQQELAQAADVSKQTIYMMERGDYSPSLLLAFRLARIFKTDISSLFTHKES